MGAFTMEDRFTKRIITIFFTSIITLMLFVCGMFLYQSNQKSKQHTAFTITLEKDSINFHGATSDIVPYKDIHSIQYYEQKLPSGKNKALVKPPRISLSEMLYLMKLEHVELIYISMIPIISR